MYKVKPGRACGKGEGGVRNASGQNSCSCQPSVMETSLESRMLGNQPVRFGKLRHEVASVAVGTVSTGPNPMLYHRYPTKTCAWSNSGVGSSWDNEASPAWVATQP